MAPTCPEEIDVFSVPHSRMKELVNKYLDRVIILAIVILFLSCCCHVEKEIEHAKTPEFLQWPIFLHCRKNVNNHNLFYPSILRATPNAPLISNWTNGPMQISAALLKVKLKYTRITFNRHPNTYSHSWEFNVPVDHISHLFIVTSIICYHSEPELCTSRKSNQ